METCLYVCDVDSSHHDVTLLHQRSCCSRLARLIMTIMRIVVRQFRNNMVWCKASSIRMWNHVKSKLRKVNHKPELPSTSSVQPCANSGQVPPTDYPLPSYRTPSGKSTLLTDDELLKVVMEEVTVTPVKQEFIRASLRDGVVGQLAFHPKGLEKEKACLTPLLDAQSFPDQLKRDMLVKDAGFSLELYALKMLGHFFGFNNSFSLNGHQVQFEGLSIFIQDMFFPRQLLTSFSGYFSEIYHDLVKGIPKEVQERIIGGLQEFVITMDTIYDLSYDQQKAYVVQLMDRIDRGQNTLTPVLLDNHRVYIAWSQDGLCIGQKQKDELLRIVWSDSIDRTSVEQLLSCDIYKENYKSVAFSTLTDLLFFCQKHIGMLDNLHFPGQKKQKVGNCGWASMKAMVQGFLFASFFQYYLREMSPEKAREIALEISRKVYKSWSLYFRVLALEGYQNNTTRSSMGKQYRTPNKTIVEACKKKVKLLRKKRQAVYVQPTITAPNNDVLGIIAHSSWHRILKIKPDDYSSGS